MTSTPIHPVRLDRTSAALTIEALTVAHPAVTTEALRWTTGTRGAPVTAEQAADADLTAYAEQALIVGAQAIAAAGGAQDTYNLEQLIQDVGSRTTEASATAAEATGKAITGAADSMRQITSEVTKALKEANDASRETFTTTVTQARTDLQKQVLALIGGDDPQLVASLDALLTKFGTSLTDRTDKQTASLFEKATKALDPADPTSPLARHQHELAKQQADLTLHLNSQHAALVTSVEEIKTSLASQKAAAEAASKMASVTPLKGGTYEARVHDLPSDIAVGLGDEYAETGAFAGATARCKKGDGDLTVMGGTARVVVEMSTTKSPREWTAYLEEAETNRAANASIGLVPKHGPQLRPDDARAGAAPDRGCLRTAERRSGRVRMAVQILRVAALAAAGDKGSGAVTVARERVSPALAELSRVQKIRKSASAIKEPADSVDSEADRLSSQLHRLLLQAQTALIEPTLATIDAEGATQDASDSGAA